MLPLPSSILGLTVKDDTVTATYSFYIFVQHFLELRMHSHYKGFFLAEEKHQGISTELHSASQNCLLNMKPCTCNSKTNTTMYNHSSLHNISSGACQQTTKHSSTHDLEENSSCRTCLVRINDKQETIQSINTFRGTF